MRVVWVPHPDLQDHFSGSEKEVLMGRTGIIPIEDEE